MEKEIVYEIKKYQVCAGKEFNRNGSRNRTFTNKYELYADGKYVKTFNLLREAKKAIELHKGGK